MIPLGFGFRVEGKMRGAGSEVWALGSHRVYTGHIGVPQLREVHGPCKLRGN